MQKLYHTVSRLYVCAVISRSNKRKKQQTGNETKQLLYTSIIRITDSWYCYVNSTCLNSYNSNNPTSDLLILSKAPYLFQTPQNTLMCAVRLSKEALQPLKLTAACGIIICVRCRSIWVSRRCWTAPGRNGSNFRYLPTRRWDTCRHRLAQVSVQQQCRERNLSSVSKLILIQIILT